MNGVSRSDEPRSPSTSVTNQSDPARSLFSFVERVSVLLFLSKRDLDKHAWSLLDHRRSPDKLGQSPFVMPPCDTRRRCRDNAMTSGVPSGDEPSTRCREYARTRSRDDGSSRRRLVASSRSHMVAMTRYRVGVFHLAEST